MTMRKKEIDKKYMSEDMIGRLKVMYALQMEHTEWKIKCMDLHCRYDLEVYDSNGNLIAYIEVKDRHNKEDDYPTAFLNPPKYADAANIAEKWYYANVYEDGVIDFWQPYKMPATGITEEVKMIKKSTVENTERVPQKRLCLNFNDKCLQMPNNLRITKTDDQSGNTEPSCF